MPKFRFTGDTERVFATAVWQAGDKPRGHVAHGDVVEADDNPDPAFFAEVGAAKSTKADKE